jgi:tetratricopeptide (TPR) repeat protein
MNFFRLGLMLVILVFLALLPARGQVVGGSGGNTARQQRVAAPTISGGDIAAADRAFAEGRFADAMKMYGELVRKSGPRAELNLYLKLGEAANMIAGESMMNAVAARNAWETAAKEYPNSPDAHRRLLKFYLDYAEISALDTRLDLYRKAGAAAEKLVQLNPNDFEAQFKLQESVIEPFLFDRSSDIEAVLTAIEKLKEIQPQLRGNLDVPFFIARAQAKLGSNFIKFGRRDEGLALIKSGVETIDAAIAQSPQLAGPVFRKAQILQSVGPVAYDPAALDDEAAAGKARDRLTRDTADLLLKAIGNLKEDDPDLESIVSFAVQVQRGAGNDAAAENLLRAIIEIRPNATPARIQLGSLLSEDKARSEEILPIIEPACVPPQSLTGIKGIVAADGYRQALMVAVQTRIDLYVSLEPRIAAGDADTAAAGQDLLRRARDELAIIVPKSPPNAPRVMRLIAQMALADKDPQRAIQFLQRALPMARDMDNGLYADTLTMLGKAYIKAGDAEAARKQFDDAIMRANYIPARVAVVRLLLEQENYPQARPMIDALRNDAPAEADVQSVQAELLKWEARGNEQITAGMVEQLSEAQTSQKVNKIGVASRVGQFATAHRLLDELSAQYPNDPRVAILRADVYERANDRPAAIQALQNFDKTMPNVPQVTARLKQLSK